MRVFMAKPVQSGLCVKPPDPAPLARAPAAWARASRRARERGRGYGPGSGGRAARRARAAAETGALATATATATAPGARSAALCNLIRGRGRRGRGGVGRSNLCRTSCFGIGERRARLGAGELLGGPCSARVGGPRSRVLLARGCLVIPAAPSARPSPHPRGGWCSPPAGTWAGSPGMGRTGGAGRGFVFSFGQGLVLATDAEVPPLIGGCIGLS